MKMPEHWHTLLCHCPQSFTSELIIFLGIMTSDDDVWTSHKRFSIESANRQTDRLTDWQGRFYIISLNTDTLGNECVFSISCSKNAFHAFTDQFVNTIVVVTGMDNHVIWRRTSAGFSLQMGHVTSLMLMEKGRPVTEQEQILAWVWWLM